jgi:hypothetical protein
VLTVIAPASPGPKETAEIALTLLTTVRGPELNDRPLLPEIDSCSDAVSNTVPPCPEPNVELAIAAPPVKLIVRPWMSKSPAPPELSVVDEIRASFMVRVELETTTGPACPKPKVAVEMPLLLFSRTTGPIL